MKYGIFGGSFNPPHFEHKEICERVKRETGLDKIVLVPTGNAPHKKGLAPFEDRVKMLSFLFGDDYIVDNIESELSGLTNTARVLPILKEKYGSVCFIIGGDSMIAMDTWIEPKTVMTTCPIVVVSRQSRSEELLGAIDKYRKIGAEIRLVDYVGKDCSSTMARTYAELKLANPLIPESEANYIIKKELYNKYDDLVNEVAKRLTEKRMAHTKQVVLMAVRLNEQLGLPYDKVFTSAILHDVAKYASKTETEFEGLKIKGAYAHAFVGAEVARAEFGIKDEDIIDAIRFHTTGRADMSELEKLIFLADYIEETRSFDGVERIRKLALEDFEKGFVQAVRSQMNFLKDKTDVCPLTKECYEYYNRKE